MWSDLILLAMVCGPVREAAQIPRGPGAAKLLLEASVIVVGSVLPSAQWVVTPEDMIGKSTKRPDGTIHYENASIGDFLLGRLINFQIDEILRGQREIKSDISFRVFCEGLSTGEGEPRYLLAERYLLFLKPLDKANDRFKGTALYNLNDSSKIAFDPSAVYTPISRLYGAVLLRPGGDEIIQRVREILGKK